MAAWFAAAAASSLEGPRALEQPWADDPGFRIEWRETWQATYEANPPYGGQRWKKELDAPAADRGRREPVLALRRIRLLDALIERYPRETEKGVAARRETALRLGHSGLARRVFQDVLTHASDPLMLSRAKVGLWLAVLNETGDIGALGQERLSGRGGPRGRPGHSHQGCPYAPSQRRSRASGTMLCCPGWARASPRLS